MENIDNKRAREIIDHLGKEILDDAADAVNIPPHIKEDLLKICHRTRMSLKFFPNLSEELPKLADRYGVSLKKMLNWYYSVSREFWDDIKEIFHKTNLKCGDISTKKHIDMRSI